LRRGADLRTLRVERGTGEEGHERGAAGSRQLPLDQLGRATGFGRCDQRARLELPTLRSDEDGGHQEQRGYPEDPPAVPEHEPPPGRQHQATSALLPRLTSLAYVRRAAP